MKLLAVLLLSAISLNVFAAYPKIKFINIGGEFTDKTGVAFAQSGKYELDKIKLSHREIDVDINQTRKTLVIRDHNSTTAELDFDFKFSNVFTAFAFKGANLESNFKHFTLDIASIDFYSEKNEYHLINAVIDTNITNERNTDPNIDVLSGFMLKGRIAIEEVNFSELTNGDLLSLIYSSDSKLWKKIKKWFKNRIKLPLVLRDIEVVARSGEFSAQVLLDSFINLKISLTGKLLHSRAQDQVVIDVSEAKIGKFKMTKVILKALTLIKMKAVTVDGSKIIIGLGGEE